MNHLALHSQPRSFTLLVTCSIFLLIGIFGAPQYGEAQAKTAKVEIMVARWCSYCKALEHFLQSNNVTYIKYDIEKDPKGRALHESLGGGGVPVTRINEREIIRGYNVIELMRALGISTRPGSTIRGT
jgi:glutaredoxin